MGEGETEDEEFIPNVRKAVNAVRADYGAPPLAAAHDLDERAGGWATKLASRGHIAYAENPGIGEAITFFPTSVTGDAAVRHWAQEATKYDFTQPGWQPGTNYFTQLVWKGTSELGLGAAPTPDGQTRVLVAFFRPAGNGNRTGEFAANVLPLIQPPS